MGAYRAASKKFAWLGWLTAAIPFIITPYYAVIGGWVTKYMVSYATTPAADIAADGYFTGFILSSGPSTYIWFLVFFACVALVVAFGLKSGIERSNKVLMPLLIFLAVAIFIYVMTLDGSGAGLKYYLVPSFENYHNVGDFVQLLIAAMGQMFFSLSLAMGIMITYGSYFEKHENIEKSVRTIEIFDTGIAFLAGLMIIPAIFAVSGDGSAVATHAGPGLMFVVLPQTFATLGIAGRIIGFVFFALVFFAALTSAISLMETCVSIVQDQFKTSRKTALISAFAVVALMGIVVNMGYNVWLGADPMHTIFGTPYQANQILDFLDFMSNTVFMPIAALFTCILVGGLGHQAQGHHRRGRGRWRGLQGQGSVQRHDQVRRPHLHRDDPGGLHPEHLRRDPPVGVITGSRGDSADVTQRGHYTWGPWNIQGPHCLL